MPSGLVLGLPGGSESRGPACSAEGLGQSRVPKTPWRRERAAVFLPENLMGQGLEAVCGPEFDVTLPLTLSQPSS